MRGPGLLQGVGFTMEWSLPFCCAVAYVRDRVWPHTPGRHLASSLIATTLGLEDKAMPQLRQCRCMTLHVHCSNACLLLTPSCIGGTLCMS